MRSLSLPIMLLGVCAALSGFQGAPERLSSGIELKLPQGWRLNPTGTGAVLVPPQHDAENELYIAGNDPQEKNLDDPQLGARLMARHLPQFKPTAAGAATPFKTAGGRRGILHAFTAQADNAPAAIRLYLVDLSGGIAILTAVGRPEPVSRRSADLLAIASTFTGSIQAPQLSTSSSANSNAWVQRLSDKKLVQFSGYNSSGNSGGMNSQRTLYLSASGEYAFRSQSSVSMNVPGATGSSTGQTADQGKWKIVEQGGQAFLELTSSKQRATERIALSLNGTQTLLNGKRWFVVGINE